MSETVVAREQSVVPYLYYEDGIAALDFLTHVLGFIERTRSMRDDDTLLHAEVLCEGDVIMLGTPLGENGPLALHESRMHHSSVMCYVNNVDERYESVLKANTKIVSELHDKSYGRMFAVEDAEGHQWYIAESNK